MPFLCSPACFIHMWFLVFCEDSGSFSQMAFSSLSGRYYRASVEEHLATTGSLFAPHFCFQTMWFENITPMLLAVWVLGKASLMWVYQLYCSNCSRKPGLLLAEFSVMRVLPWCGDHLCLTRKTPVECPCRVREELLSLSTDMLGAGSHLCSYPVEMTNDFQQL